MTKTKRFTSLLITFALILLFLPFNAKAETWVYEFLTEAPEGIIVEHTYDYEGFGFGYLKSYPSDHSFGTLYRMGAQTFIEGRTGFSYEMFDDYYGIEPFIQETVNYTYIYTQPNVVWTITLYDDWEEDITSTKRFVFTTELNQGVIEYDRYFEIWNPQTSSWEFEKSINASGALIITFKKEQHMVSYFENGGYMERPTFFYDRGDKLFITNEIPTKEGYTFTGWKEIIDPTWILHFMKIGLQYQIPSYTEEDRMLSYYDEDLNGLTLKEVFEDNLWYSNDWTIHSMLGWSQNNVDMLVSYDNDKLNITAINTIGTKGFYRPNLILTNYYYANVDVISNTNTPLNLGYVSVTDYNLTPDIKKNISIKMLPTDQYFRLYKTNTFIDDYIIWDNLIIIDLTALSIDHLTVEEMDDYYSLYSDAINGVDNATLNAVPYSNLMIDAWNGGLDAWTQGESDTITDQNGAQFDDYGISTFMLDQAKFMFDLWETNPNFDVTTAYADYLMEPIFNTPVLNDRMFVATWEPNPPGVYTVTFNTVGGSYIASQTVTGGTALQRPSDPYKEGYQFNGWNELRIIPYNWSNSVSYDLILYADWVPLPQGEIEESGFMVFMENYWIHVSLAILVIGVVAGISTSKSKRYKRKWR